MLKDITLGQYYPSKSTLHKLDPRVKLLGTVLFIISLFVFSSISSYIVATVFLIAMIKLSKVPFRYMVRGLKAIMILMMITVVFNLFLTPGEALVHVWKLTITKEGFRMASYMTVRLVFLVLGSTIMTLTTTPNNLTEGMERGLSGLKRFHVPVHEISMMMSIALRFIPILMEETDKIMKAQEARGADFESGGVLKRAKSMIPILVPLFISAFRRANDLAMAMEARGYHGGDGRTKLYPLKYKRRDYIAYGVIAAYLICMFVVGKFVHIRVFH